MIDYADKCELLARKNRTARKEHKCSECGRTIERGEIYLDERTKFDGEIDQYRTCSHCQVGRQWLSNECGGWLYQGVEEDIREHVFEGVGGWPVARIAIGMKNRWRKKDGSLMPLPKRPLTTEEIMDARKQTNDAVAPATN